MITVIHLSNEDVRVVTGTVSGEKIRVISTCYGSAPKGSLVGGVIQDRDALMAFLKEFWEKNHLPRKNVHLTVSSPTEVGRLFEVPPMNDKKLMAYLPREFGTVERARNPVYSYIEMGKKGQNRQLFACMQDRDFLKSHLEMFSELKIKISSLQLGTLCVLHGLQKLDYLWDKTCVVQLLYGNSVINVVIVNGEFKTFNRSNVVSEPGTVAFGVECARIINNQQQFIRAQQIEIAELNVYLGGYRPEEYEVVSESIAQMDGTIRCGKLELNENCDITFSGSDDEFEYFMAAISGLSEPKGQKNLYFQCTHDPETRKKRKQMILYLAPATVTLVALSGITAVEGYRWFRNSDEMNRMFDYIGSPDIMQKAAEYDNLTAENEQLEIRIATIDNTWSRVESYPQYTTQIKREIKGAAEGVAQVEVKSFDAVSGTVKITAAAADDELMHQLVDRLDAMEIFEDIDYSGFAYNSQDATWNADIICYMKAPEVTP